MFSVIAREELGQVAWDAFVDASDEAWLWHRYDAQDAIAEREGKADLGFAILDSSSGNEIAAVVPVHLTYGKFKGIVRWSTLDSFCGVASANSLGDKHKKKIGAFAWDVLADLAAMHKSMRIDMRLTPTAPAYLGTRSPRVNPLLSMGLENTLTQTYMLDLRHPLDTLWDKLEKRARTAIRKAQKLEVSVRPAGHDDLDLYYEMHTATYTRTGARPHPKAYFEAIWSKFLPNGLAQIFFAEHDGEVIAAENFGVYKQAAVYWTGAALPEGLRFNANSLLQWSAITWMKENGIEWYETGEAFPDAQAGKQKGLSDFKRSFGGELYPYYRGRKVFQALPQAFIDIMARSTR